MLAISIIGIINYLRQWNEMNWRRL